jgi:hypothetical protein
MKPSLLNNKSPSEIATEIFQGTKVESAFDHKGKFKFLIAKLPKNDFNKIYSSNTTVTIFIQGYWLQLSLHSNQKTILNRENNSLLNTKIYQNEFNITILELYYFGKKVVHYKFKELSPEDLLKTTKGYYILAKAAVKAFTRLPSGSAIKKALHYFYPIVQVLPKETNKEFFDPSKVNIQ